MKYVLTDSTYLVRNVDGGRNGQPVWCEFPFYAHRFDTHEDAVSATVSIRRKGWDVRIRELTGDDITLLNPGGDLCYVCGPDPITDRPCTACGV